MDNSLISRQDALDALDDIESEVADGFGFQYEKWRKHFADLPTAQPDVPDINVGDLNKFIDGLVEIFADIRESHVDDSVCGLCEFDGAYIGESGDWCNECPGFNRDDCFKLRDGIRKKWIAEITACVPSAQPKRKRGEWLDNETSFADGVRQTCTCSVCGRRSVRPLGDFADGVVLI